MEAAEEELFVETEHSKKFLFRGDGLRTDFAKAGQSRRRSLVIGASDNEKALWQALEEAEAAGLPQELCAPALVVRTPRCCCAAAAAAAETAPAQKKEL